MNKRRFFAVIAALLICLILLVSASYAWFTMSSAPEITGIETHVGANGSLEIALLSSATYEDPSQIRTLVGGSAVTIGSAQANLAWGNVVELIDSVYGLQQITLRPARLNIHTEEDQHIVGNNILQFPEYRFDGRFESMLTNTVTATYQDSSFLFSTLNQGFGVRAIGSVSDVTPHQSALASARSYVRTYRAAALSSTESIWKANGAKLINLYLDYYYRGVTEFTNADVALIRDSAVRAMSATSYLDLALRQGIIGYAASAISDETMFLQLRDLVANTKLPLSALLDRIDLDLPNNISSWVDRIESDSTQSLQVVQACNRLTSGTYTWEQIGPLLNVLFSDTRSYINDHKISTITPDIVLGGTITLSLHPEAGVLSTVSDYAGNYDVLFSIDSTTTFQAVTLSSQSPAYLVSLAEWLDGVELDGQINEAVLEDTYGYAIDLAFRCNASADLLLQTIPADRIEENDSLESLSQGNGSFMFFQSENLTTDQTVSVMDAIRIAFVDNKNQMVALAKLNTSNFEETEDGIKAPLYLYEYSVSVDGTISVGQRREEGSAITELTANKPLVMTAIVWLDGDHVDNMLVAISGQSLTGTLNLQFSSSADLKPADIPIN